MVLCLLVAVASAREFRAIEVIATPAALPADAMPPSAPRPIPRAEVERAVQAVADAWNGGALDPLLGDAFASKSRLLDTIAEVVPRDARLEVLAVQGVSLLAQYRYTSRTVSTVSAVVRTQVTFNDPVTGYQRLEGSTEWIFEVVEADNHAVASTLSKGHSIPGDALERPSSSASMGTLAAPRPDAGEALPFISSISPDPLRLDRQVVIRGGNFGASPGVITIVRREGRVIVPVTLSSWSDGYITATLGGSDLSRGRSHLASALRDAVFGGRAEAGPVEAVLWVVAHGSTALGQNRASQEVVFARLPEVIGVDSPTRLEGFVGGREHALEAGLPVTTAAVTPGGAVQVRGINFLPPTDSAPAGAVTFHVGDRDIPARIDSWSDRELTVTLPLGVEGLTAQMAGLSVTNVAGDAVREDAAVYFWPTMVGRWARYPFTLSCRRAIDDHLRATMGERLQPGWEITDSAVLSYEYDPPLPDDRWCRFGTGRPRPGDDSTRHTVVCQCPPAVDYSIHGEVRVHLRGPAGTDYHGAR